MVSNIAFSIGVDPTNVSTIALLEIKIALFPVFDVVSCMGKKVGKRARVRQKRIRGVVDI